MVINGGETSLNLLILDYPINKEWKSDERLQRIINFISSYFDENKIENEIAERGYDLSNIRNIIEIDAHGDFDFKTKNDLYKILNDNGIEFNVVYEETSVYNVGADGGGLKIVLSFLNGIANAVTVLDYINKYFSYKNDPAQLHNMKDIKSSISKQYEIHESQLTLVSHEYDQQMNQMDYIFKSRYHEYLITIEKGKIVKSTRDKIN